ncbi:unnamed protein product [Heligmosomoides polygyrus]|uniref:50S ribosomal protein L20 n=1 Tax=Heligmosomoides polygyrus TaxID=6339 RepID=A0A183FLD5_HELPZ|nr:unnamed protein product [Heligmosomoides polygyrus]
MLDLAIAHDLAVCSTFFAKRETQKVTYARGGRRTEVDYIPAAVKRKKEAYKLWQKTRAPEHLTAYGKLKRLATAVAKAKNAEMDAVYEKLDGPEGAKFAIRLAKAHHRASLDIRRPTKIRVVKTVKSADGRVLRKRSRSEKDGRSTPRNS